LKIWKILTVPKFWRDLEANPKIFDFIADIEESFGPVVFETIFFVKNLNFELFLPKKTSKYLKSNSAMSRSKQFKFKYYFFH
jgi:hypothetical protein